MEDKRRKKVTVVEAAEHLGLSRTKVQEMVDRGIIKADKFAGAVHIPREEVERIERETAPWAGCTEEKEGDTVEDVHVYVERPAGKEDADLEDLGEALRGLDHVFEVHVDASGNVVAVSYEGGTRGREAIERAVEEAGYGVSRLSVTSDFEEGWKQRLWDVWGPEACGEPEGRGILTLV
jgi:excisionase family DNA binding protein